ncbi:MAG: tetratricopeptide repeat protein [Candidatus Riflebacteria bacterium]|nr:tetratricopeptide repeat protein [Candidatus Riflebacteria bacterium]
MMRRFIIILLLLPALFGRRQMLIAQPFDYLVPDSTIGDSLSTELRRLQSIERDVALEKLNRPPTTFEALLELADLRRSQSRLEEAERLYEMALERRPDNMDANQGLAMVYFQTGRSGKAKDTLDRLLQLYPLSDKLQEDLQELKSKLSTTGEVGTRIHEDNRGVQEISSSLELYFPSFTWPKLGARYRVETLNFKDGAGETNSRVLSSSFEYAFNHRSRLAFTFAPETSPERKDMAGYEIHGVTGNEILHLAAYSGRTSYNENVSSIRLGLSEDYNRIVLFGEVHERARISQSFTSGKVSDGNARRRFETDLLYFITRRGVPMLSLDLQLYQSSFERSFDSVGKPLVYWAPTDYTGGRFSVSWERGVGSRWWWGCETHVIGNHFHDASTTNGSEAGVGYLLHASYRFETGRLHGEFADTIRDYYRERTLGVFGSIDF